MLAEQRSNVEAGVAAKLEELMGEANDMLRDYIMVMVDNGKDMPTVATDLEDLIGQEHAAAIASWLGDALASASGATADDDADLGSGDNQDQVGLEQREVNSAAEASSTSPRGMGRRPAGHLLASALAGASRADEGDRDHLQQVKSRGGRRAQNKAAGKGRNAGERPAKKPLSERLGARVSDATAADLSMALQAPQRGEKRNVVAPEDAEYDDAEHVVKYGKGKGKGGKGKGKGVWWVPVPQAYYWSAGKGKGKGKGKGSSTFSKIYVNPELAQNPASAVGGDSAEGSTSGGGDAAATSSASGTTTVVPLGKGKGGKGKGKGKGKGGPAPAYSKVWERALTKDEGLLTPR